MSRTLKIITGVVAALVVLVAIGIGVFLLMPTIVGATSTTSTATAVIAANTTATPVSNKTEIARYIRQYASPVETQLAQGLKLTSDQLTSQLRSGKTLTQIATDQKVSGTQLNMVIATALQNGLQPAVTSGGITQKQVSNLVKRFQKNPDQLGKLLIAPDHKKATSTPQATPTP